jgi:hypothetical protein
MSFSQFHGKAYLIPQVFYKKEMKSKFAKAFWGMLRKALKKSLHYPDFWSLSVMGYPPPLCPKGGGGITSHFQKKTHHCCIAQDRNCGGWVESDWGPGTKLTHKERRAGSRNFCIRKEPNALCRC